MIPLENPSTYERLATNPINGEPYIILEIPIHFLNCHYGKYLAHTPLKQLFSQKDLRGWHPDMTSLI